MIVAFSVRARADLIEIGDWIAQDDDAAADRFVEKLIAASEQIGEHPTLYPLVSGSRTLRRRLISPYLIFYRIRRNDVFIVSIRHGARDNRRLR